MNVAVPELDVSRAHAAYEVYRRITRSPANKNTARRFYKFLGARDLQEGADGSFQKQWDQIAFMEQARNRVEWLLGPNAEVMYRVWEAQNERT